MCLRWLSLVAIIFLVKFVLECIPVYLIPLDKFPTYILEKIRHKCFNFHCTGRKVKNEVHLVRWDRLDPTNMERGWGLMNIFNFKWNLKPKVFSIV